MKLRLLMLSFFSFLFLFYGDLYSKDFELVFHKSFLQKIVEKIFPLTLKESYAPGLKIPNMDGSLSLGYKVDIEKPVLTIFKNCIMLEATSKIVSDFGNNSFPVRCKMVPAYNSKSNCIEFKTQEGTADMYLGTGNSYMSLGSIDISQYISNIKIPLKIENVLINDKYIKPQFKNVVFQFYKDKIVMDSDIKLN